VGKEFTADKIKKDHQNEKKAKKTIVNFLGTLGMGAKGKNLACPRHPDRGLHGGTEVPPKESKKQGLRVKEGKKKKGSDGVGGVAYKTRGGKKTKKKTGGADSQWTVKKKTEKAERETGVGGYLVTASNFVS